MESKKNRGGRPKIENKRNIQLKIMLNKEEHALLNRMFIDHKNYGYSNKSDYIRSLIFDKASTITTFIKSNVSDRNYLFLNHFTFQLKKIGTNLNQLMRLVNKDGTTSKLETKELSRFNSMIDDIDKVFSELKKEL